MIGCLIFFFKQKTAYEMRISDWSSDVCSSDLTAVWTYDGRVPGAEIRVRQGDRLRVLVTNRLSEETTVHWHGIRVPNAMDGVPHLQPKPIGDGETYIGTATCRVRE